MRVMAQLGMVMNLDKCIGCHTCSVTCKQAWTNRTGMEYVWFNNVETRPGQGYPRTYQDQEKWRGGWELNRRGRLRLKGGGRLRKLLTIFANPKLPSIADYYEPWTYDYEKLISAPLGDQMPVAQPEYERSFMFYLPRICEHCLNPSCVASCPSGAIYKRAEDGIVLVDQNRCRSWRQCVTGCPYKKIYFNHKTGKAEKCTFCYPRVEVGLPTVCSETCVGRLRYLGLFLYDADAVLAAASVPDPKDLYAAQLDVLLDPYDPEVVRAAAQAGISAEWIDAAQRSPVYKLAKEYRVALPLHPEYRTMPMVWYIPPLSPVVDALRETGHDAEDSGNLFGAISSLRIPVEYLAELFTAGDTAVVDGVLRRLAAMRSYQRDLNLGRPARPEIPAGVGMTEESISEMYRLLAIAKYDDRYVIPTAYQETGRQLEEIGCSLDYEGGPGMYLTGSKPFGEASGRPVPVAVETFHALRHRQTSDEPAGPETAARRVNLLNWDGQGRPPGLFPPRAGDGDAAGSASERGDER